MDGRQRVIVNGLRVANVTFFGIAILLFLTAAVGAILPRRSNPRTAVGAAQVGPGRTPSPTPASTTTIPTVVLPTTPAAPPGPPAASQPGQCHTSDLAITDNGGRDAGGVFLGTMVISNRASGPCTLYGYPGLARFDARGQPLRTTVVRDRRATISLVTIAPQQQASFGYATADRPANALMDCAHATAVAVTPPDETTQVAVSSPLVACGPADMVTVGPVAPGPAATLAGLS